MPYFALTYEVVADFVNQRPPFRPSHLKEVRDALLVFRAADKSTAESFAKADPSVKEGLVKKWTVRPWTRRRPGSVGDATGPPGLIDRA